jgi:transposase
MHRFIDGEDRLQQALLPHSLEDYVDEENPVRVIEIFVDELDLATLGFSGMRPAATGRPAYHPSTLLKIYLYGYLNRLQSSRRLEREAQRNIELMWLTGRLAPDFKTIADFRKDNGAAIQAVCSQFVVLCRQLGLFTRAVVAIDGSKFKAVNNRDMNYTVAKVTGRMEQVNASIARYLRALDQADREESDIAEAKSGRLKEKIAGLRRQMQALKVMEQTVQDAPDQQVSLTDPDARSMATSGKGTATVGYNVQIAVDAEHHLIVAHEVINQGYDRHQLAPMAFKAQQATGCGKITALADRGYFNGDWQDFISHLQEMTGKRLKGRLGGGAGYTVRTDDLMAEAGCLYHTSWIIDDQPWPLNVRGGQKFIFVPYSGQTNDAGMLAWNREADYFQQMIKDQFDTLYREGAENGRVMCLALHPHNIGRPNAAKHLDDALSYSLGHDGVWATTADDIAEYYLATYYDQVKSWIAERKVPAER